ncbi:putative Ig domain-containing protein, partial [Amphritea balenae]
AGVADDKITLINAFSNAYSKMESVEFADGTILSSSYLTEAAYNNAPQLIAEISDQSLSEGSLFSYTIPPESFTDPDAGDTLNYQVTDADGSALPEWLAFDAETLTLSGTPPMDAPNLQLKVTATDSYGLSVSNEFSLTIEPLYNEIVGTNSKDDMRGTDGTDHLLGLNGDDILSGLQGDDWLEGGEGRDTLYGNEGDDRLEGGNAVDKLYGHAGNDHIVGGAGNDVMNGGDGDDIFVLTAGDNGFDTVFGDLGYDILMGTEQDDQIALKKHKPYQSLELIDGAEGHNVIIGHDGKNYLDLSETELINIAHIDGRGGNDTLKGSAGNDLLIGGLGDDSLFGGEGDDRFLTASEQGYDRYNGGEGFDRVIATDADDQIGLKSHAATSSIEQIDGGAGSNIILGNHMSNRLIFTQTELINIAAIDGAAGNDYIKSTDLNDVLIGGTGNDRLLGGLGGDEYLFDEGDGQDVVYELNGGGIDDLDRIVFGQAETTDSLWFSRNGEDLVVDVIGSDDQVTIQRWYKRDTYKVEQIETRDAILHDENVDALVQAMAAFDAPTGVGSVIPDEVKEQLQPLLSSSWTVV